MRCPTCGGLSNVTSELVRALIDNASWWSQQGIDREYSGLKLVDKQIDYDFEREHTPIHLVFQVLEDGSFWKMTGSADSYGEQDWNRPFKVTGTTKTVTVWE